jgi:hypothetical protein
MQVFTKRILFVLSFIFAFAAPVLAAPALAQQGTYIASPQVMEFVVRTLLIGSIMPGVIAVINRSYWPTAYKANAAWIICFAAAVIQTVYQQWQMSEFTVDSVMEFVIWLVTNFAAIQITTKGMHDGVWRPTGVANKIEVATTGTAPADATPAFVAPPFSSLPSGETRTNVLDEIPEYVENEPDGIPADEVLNEYDPAALDTIQGENPHA